VRDLFLTIVLPRVSRGEPMAWVYNHRVDWQSPVAGQVRGIV
jgi:hypothetical protein